jgi:hypothetical protein
MTKLVLEGSTLFKKFSKQIDSNYDKNTIDRSISNDTNDNISKKSTTSQNNKKNPRGQSIKIYLTLNSYTMWELER